MNTSSRTQIILAIKNFDINKLETLLDDKRSYMDVSKSLFLKTLEKKFELAKENGCDSFDDVFFGICESCNKGCEGMTFYSNSGYYLDLYVEEENETVIDIYVCNKLVNFTNLKKTYDLGFNFKLDQALLFKPDSDYKIISKQYKSLLEDIAILQPNIKLDELESWYDGFSYTRNFIDKTSFFVVLRYDFYYKVSRLIGEIDKIINLRRKAHYALDALLDFQKATTERDRLIWFFENRKDYRATEYFTIPPDLSSDKSLSYRCHSVNREITFDISGYEFVIDYFRKLDEFHYQLLEKYRPSDELYDEAGEEGLIYSIENFLTIHKVHLDLLEKYGRVSY